MNYNQTKDYYNKNAASYAENTLSINMNSSYEAFLQYLPRGSHILDAGCGAGRDTKNFLSSGYRVTAFDFSEEFVKWSSIYTGQQTLHLGFHEICFEETFDGIWCSASLLHLPSPDLGSAMENLKRALKERGIWFLSFKYGDFEGYDGERYFTHRNEASLRQMIQQVEGLDILNMWTDRSSAGKDQVWIQAILQKNSSLCWDHLGFAKL